MPGSNTPKTAKPKKFRITIHDLQKKHPLRLSRLRRQAEAATTLLARRLPRSPGEIEISLLTPAAIGRVHDDFMGDPTPTDVITFDHGEILLCPAVADKQRKAEGLSLHDEVLTYILHGLLHLCGLDDLTQKDFNRMRKEQTRLLEKVRLIK